MRYGELFRRTDPSRVSPKERLIMVRFDGRYNNWLDDQ